MNAAETADVPDADADADATVAATDDDTVDADADADAVISFGGFFVYLVSMQLRATHATN